MKAKIAALPAAAVLLDRLEALDEADSRFLELTLAGPSQARRDDRQGQL